MRKFHSLPGFALGVVLLIVSFIFITKSREASAEYKEEKAKIADILNFNDRLLSFRDWVFTQAAWEEKKAEMDTVIQTADEKYKKSVRFGTYLLIAVLVFMVWIIGYYAWCKRVYWGITLALVFSGFAMLGEGVMNPALEISAFKEELTIQVHVNPDDFEYFRNMKNYIEKTVEGLSGYVDYVRVVPFVGDDAADGIQQYIDRGKDYIDINPDMKIGFDKVFPGKTYFYYQNKGIMDVIKLLWEHGNKPVAAAIGVFSIVVPILKLLLSLLILVAPVTGAKRLRKILTYLAKWSMADVFVIGLFLAYLSFANMSTGVDMESGVLFGLYYFAGYVILSIFLSYALDAAVRERKRLTENPAETTPDGGER